MRLFNRVVSEQLDHLDDEEEVKRKNHERGYY